MVPNKTDPAKRGIGRGGKDFRWGEKSATKGSWG